MTEKIIHSSIYIDEQKIVKPKLFDYNLEALRGVAAMLVVWHHIVYAPGILDPGYTPKGLWSFDPPAHLCVLVFFVLSGYVIGLNHGSPITVNAIGNYLKKRVVRIYPIYAFAILLTLLVAATQYPITTIISHFSMMQALTSPVIAENAPAWSLHYEILYYLLFLPISYFRINPIITAIGCFVIGVVNFYLYPHFGTPLLSAYAFGFTFWLSGLALSRYKPAHSTASFALMMSMLFLLLSFEKFNILSTALSKLSVRLLGTDMAFPASVPWYQKAVTFQDFAFLPFCLLAMTVFSSKDFKFKNGFIFLLLFVPALTFYSFYKHFNEQDNASLVLPSLFYVLSVITYLLRDRIAGISRSVVTQLIKTGSISYGLYIIHYPVFYIFNQWLGFSGTAGTFVFRLFLYLFTCTLVALVLEKKYQPWIKKLVR